jgi:hypothetical protein
MSNHPKRSNSRVRIIGEGRDEWGRRYIKFCVEGSERDIPPVAVEQLVSDPTRLFAALADAGWNGFTRAARNELLLRLQERKPKAPAFRVATRLGWNSGAYILPDVNIGDPEEPLEKVFGDLDPLKLDKYRARGTLQEWQNSIAAICTGNSRLIFSACLAFTGPILSLVKGPKAGGFQIYGRAETGKTTAAIIAGSVWGCHRGEGRREKGFAESWRTTPGKVEVTALTHNDGLLILDETRLAGTNDRERAEVVTSVAFALAEMTEKERLTNPGSARSWRCYFLSTSNLSLRELGRRGNIIIDEAHRGRMDDIPLPTNGNGIFEDLHSFPNGEALSDALQRRARQYHGTPSRTFIRELVRAWKADLRGLKQLLEAQRKFYRKKLARAVKHEKVKPLSRTSGRYATVFAAGSVASKYGILPWARRAILKSILSCELDQLRQLREESDDLAVPSAEDLRARLVRYLADHQGEFMDLRKRRPRYGRDEFDAVAGYHAKFKGQRYYYLAASQLNAIVGTSSSARTLKETLAGEGLLVRKDKRFVVQRPLFKGGKGRENYAWVHAIKADILNQTTGAASR